MNLTPNGWTVEQWAEAMAGAAPRIEYVDFHRDPDRVREIESWSCPECGGLLSEETTPHGSFYVCTGWADRTKETLCRKRYQVDSL